MTIPVWRQRVACDRCKREMSPSSMGLHRQRCFDLTVESLIIYGRVVLPQDPNECWIWRGRRDTSSDRSRSYAHTPYGRANRAMYTAAYGVDPAELDVCHTCDDPMCVNPRHLWLGTASQNVKDAYDKGRQPKRVTNPPRGDDHWLHKQPERAAALMVKVRSSITDEGRERQKTANRGRVHTESARRNMQIAAICREERKRGEDA